MAVLRAQSGGLRRKGEGRFRGQRQKSSRDQQWVGRHVLASVLLRYQCDLSCHLVKKLSNETMHFPTCPWYSLV